VCARATCDESYQAVAALCLPFTGAPMSPDTPAPSAVPIVVAVVDTNPEIVRMLRVSLEQAGFVAISMHIENIKTGEANLKSMLEEHNPKVIIYDIAPPYEQSLRFLDHLRTTTDFRNRRFVLTSVNVRAVQEVVGREETVYEIVGKDTDILEIVRAVKEATRARPTR
jgi:CheY-like chemotaxis protein